MFLTSQCISLVFPWNWKSLSHVWLFVTPMDYTVYEILQARILEKIAIPYSSRSSWPMNPTRVSWIAGRLFISWAIREALCFLDEIYSDVFWSILENFTCALEKNACFAAFGWNVATLNMFPRIRPVKSTLPSRLFDFFFFTISVPTRTWWNLICIRNTILHDSYTQWSWGNTNLEQVFSPSPVEKWGCIITCIEYCRCVAVLLQILTNILRAKLSPVENQWLSWNMEASWQNSDQSPFLPQFEPFNKSFNCFRCIYFCSGK